MRSLFVVTREISALLLFYRLGARLTALAQNDYVIIILIIII